MTLPKLKIGNRTAKFPIIQGGMGIGVSLSKLASAVANEGGIGIISGAQPGFKEDNFRTDNDQANITGLIKEIRKAKSLSPDGIIGVNFLQASNNYSDLVKAAVKEKVDLIISGAGLPKKLPEFVKGTDTSIAPIVSSGRAAKLLSKLWKKRYDYLPDAIVVEGPKAGGHLGFKMEEIKNKTAKTLDTILEEVISTVKPIEEKYKQKIPVIAAGGIFSGQDIKKFLSLGASGVQIATRFVATEECDAHENFKKAYVNATEENIGIIESPVGLPGRALKNKFFEDLKNHNLKIKSCYRCLKKCNPKVAPFCITEALVKAVNGDADNGLIFIGDNGDKVNSITTVKQVFKELIEEYNS